MSSDNIIDMAARRAGLPPPVIDLWEFATIGATADGRLSLGMELPDVVRFLGVHRDSVKLEDSGLPGHRHWLFNHNYVLNFDPHDRLDGLYFDANVDFSDLVPTVVKEAVARRNFLGDAVDSVEMRITETIPVRLRGKPLSSFATLPLFAGTMHDVMEWEIATRGKEKWLSFRHATEHGRFNAQFILNAFQTPYCEGFNIDYCLLGIGHLKTFEMKTESNTFLSID